MLSPKVVDRLLPALVCAIAPSLGACAETRVSLAAGPREYVPSDYLQVLKTWTRDESLVVFSELEHKLTVTATFESWDFRWAYVVRYAADYRLTIEERRQLLDRTLRESQDDHEFYVALYGSNWRWADISRPTIAPGAKWFGLRFAGAEGSEELVWKLTPADAHPSNESANAGR